MPGLAAVTTATLLTTIGWLPTGLRWRTSDQPVPFCISANATSTNVNATAQQNAVLQGIGVWVSTAGGGSLSCSTYTVQTSNQCSVGVNTSDQNPNIFWESNWSNGSGTIGVTWSTGYGQPGGPCGSVSDDTGSNHNLSCKYDSDIEFNDVHYTWRTNGSSTDIASIAAHEYGHFIGLDHCNVNGTCTFGNAVMFASYGGGAVRTPYADDVQGACALYPGTQGGIGWPCTSNNQCNSNVCVDPGANGYCSQTCGTCPTGYVCGNAAFPGVCVRDDGTNRGTCETCQGIPNACANGGICVGGIPEANGGRCIAPCGAGGTCDPLFRCVTYTDGNNQVIGDFCYPRSSDCTDLNNIMELGIGQRCANDTPPCADPLTCISAGGDGICSQECTGPGQCPNGFACELFDVNDGWCLPAVYEGDSCEDLFVSCADGYCLRNPADQRLTCYKDCENMAGACNNAQVCRLVNLSGGGAIEVCDPPGVPPNPRDAGVTPQRDGGSTNPNRDGGTTNPNRDAGMSVMPTRDGGVGNTPRDAGVISTFCGCDFTYSCDPDQINGGDCQCDPECICLCDETYSCDPGCDNCDPECAARCACQSVPTGGATAASLALLALLGGLLALRRRSC
ncbi:MAG: matrixin family metalloprotease [Deltaproteobacteria bacterium]|jgi:hypothetical protein